jgi:hypothetical protein
MFGWLKRGPTWESPVGDPDRLDIVAQRRDGVVELLMVFCRPLDDSAQTREVVTRKLRNSCRYIVSPVFAQEFGAPSEDRVCLALRSDWELPHEYIELLVRVSNEEQAPAQLVVRYEDL